MTNALDVGSNSIRSPSVSAKKAMRPCNPWDPKDARKPNEDLSSRNNNIDINMS